MIYVIGMIIRRGVEMIKGIGIDIIELERIKNLMKNERFKKRILTKNELQQYEALTEKRKVEFLAGRFAAKEAYAKAYGTGIGEQLSFQDIEIQNNDKGKPMIRKPLNHKVHLSISHSQDFAVAQVIIEETV